MGRAVIVTAAMCLLAAIAGTATTANAERPERDPSSKPTGSNTRPISAQPSRVASQQDSSPAPPAPREELDDDGGAVPPGYARVTGVRPWRAVLGGTLFVLAYAPAAFLGFAGLTYEKSSARCKDCEDQSVLADQFAPYAIPAVGPLIGIGTLCDGHTACALLSAADALVQTAGAYFLVTGLMEHSVLRRTEHPIVALRSVSAAPLPGGGILSVSAGF